MKRPLVPAPGESFSNRPPVKTSEGHLEAMRQIIASAYPLPTMPLITSTPRFLPPALELLPRPTCAKCRAPVEKVSTYTLGGNAHFYLFECHGQSERVGITSDEVAEADSISIGECFVGDGVGDFPLSPTPHPSRNT